MNRIKRRVWVIAGLYRSLFILPIVGSSSSLRQISWWQLLLVLVGSENDVVVQPRHIVLVAYNLVSLIVFIEIVAVIIVEGRVRDTHRGAHAARTTSLSLEQILFTSAVHELK
jgi:membrane protein required for beta-lactamase induction